MQPTREISGTSKRLLGLFAAFALLMVVGAVHAFPPLAEMLGDRQVLSWAVGGVVLLAIGLSGALLLLYRRRHAQEDMLHRARIGELLQTTIDAIEEGILLIGSGGRVLRSNQRFRRLWNISDELLATGEDERLLGFVADQLVDPEAFRDQVARLYASDEIAVETLAFKDGRIFERYTCPVDCEQGHARLWSFRDITESKRAAESLRESEARYRQFIDEAPLGIVIARDGVMRVVNKALIAMVGATIDEIEGHDFLQYVHEADRERVTDIHRRRMSGEQMPVSYECRFVIRSGEVRWWRLAVRAIDWEGSAALAVVSDITELRQAEESLRLAASVFDSAHDGIVITDAAANILNVNAAFTRITGYGREEVLGKNPRMLKSGHQDQAFYDAMWRTLREAGHWSGEVWNRRKDGQVYAELLTVSKVLDAQGEVARYVGVLADITASKEYEQELERIAHFDALTGVPNRVLLADRMIQAVAQTRRAGNTMAVCYLDLDGFKPINDEFGHGAGDQLLVEVARRMKECVRGGDTVARIGGDEFVLLLLNVGSAKELELVLDRVLDAIAVPVHIDSYALAVSASLGVTLFPQDDADPDTLLRHADQAMYLAKQGGKHVYRFFDADQDIQARAHHHMQSRVKAALARNEFVLHYQPKVNMRSGSVVGLEALIRWQHPEEGLLSPAEFLPPVDGTDLIVAIGDWVIDTALAQLGAWRREGLETCVSINIAPRHLLREDFLDRLRQHLDAHAELPRACLEIEVLETAALEDNLHVAGIIQACREMGVSFALDDFGTGYSSLTYLKTLPAQTLKIDQSFVRDMLTSDNDLAIVEGVIGLTEVFRRKVIAEGVETIEHGTRLLNLGCELAQGFGIARPMPAASVADWIRHWKPDIAWSSTGGVRWPRDDFPLLIAEGNHRVWIEQLTAQLDEASTDTAEADCHVCQFGHWYAGEGRRRYGGLREYAAIGRIHEEVHALGAELVRLARQGDAGKARDGLPALRALSDHLLDLMHKLMAAAMMG